jgi:hypothetical protein
MKISRDWLQQFVDISDLSDSDKHTTEVEKSEMHKG